MSAIGDQPTSLIDQTAASIHFRVPLRSTEFGNALAHEILDIGAIEVAPEPWCLGQLDDDQFDKITIRPVLRATSPTNAAGGSLTPVLLPDLSQPEAELSCCEVGR